MKLPADVVSRLRSKYQGRSVCVTGGAGFIGGHLCDALLALGATITVLDDLSNSTAEHVASLMDLEPRRVRFVHGSVLDDDALIEASGRSSGGDGCQIVFHLAAIGSVPKSVANPQRAWSVNATGTLRVLVAASSRSAGGHGPSAERVVLASSSSVYGDPAVSVGASLPPLPKTETMLPRPLSPYAASKLAAESLMAAWSHCYGVSTVSLRYFNVFGPRQSPDSEYAAVVPAMAKRLLSGHQASIFGDGKQGRDFTYVGNAVLGTLLAGVAEWPFRGEAVNVAAGRRTTVLELAQMLARACGADGRSPEFLPERSGDVRDSLADLGRAREMLGYEPVTSLEAGIVETMAHYRTIFGIGAGSRPS
ncbi:MAG: NAD-dependent epimerase/dehydratase family protein [Phycisphaeraceae bacterium]|nr:NAD-dependent epimerase/dehydratase family protein [Phycisphaeraceae bacterium]HRJ48915.1 NAD-dependent epimerase/dehydratase family protein [Phycisphaerales bacterium]